MLTATLPNFTMNYITFGSGSETLVILPGLSVESVLSSAEVIKQAYSMFTKKFTVYLFDRRNELPDTYTVAQMAADTYEAMKAVGIETANIFGASQGGMIGLEIAIDHPEFVKKILVASTTVNTSSTNQEVVEEWLRLAGEGKAQELYLSFGKAIYPKAVFNVCRSLFVSSAKKVTGDMLKRFAVLAEGMRGFDIEADLEKIGCPLLYVGAKDDKVLGSEAVKPFEQFSVYMYEHFGHAVYDTAPDFKKRMYEFFTG